MTDLLSVPPLAYHALCSPIHHASLPLSGPALMSQENIRCYVLRAKSPGVRQINAAPGAI